MTMTQDSTNDYGMPGWLFGSLLMVVSAFSASCGNMAMKKAQMIEDMKDKEGRPSLRIGSIPIKNPWWWLGLFTLALAPTPLEMLALSTAGQSIVYPLGAGLTIVFSQLVAPLAIGEQVTRIDWIATLLVVFGGTLTVVFGTHASDRYSLNELLGFWKSKLFLAWFIPAWIISGVIMFFWRKNKQILLSMGNAWTLVALGFTSAVWAATQGIVLKNTSQLFRYQAFSNSSTGFDPDGNQDTYQNPFLRFETYIFIVAVPVVGIFQLVYLNYGLQYFDATKFIPVYNTQVVIVAAITGALYYQEYRSLHPIAFPFGIIFVCAGILLLLLKTNNSSSSRHASNSSVELISEEDEMDVSNGLETPILNNSHLDELHEVVSLQLSDSTENPVNSE